jgi:hypothetical protein
MKTYRTSPSGRRTAIILLMGALIIWAFALWTFGSTLGISYNPVQFWGTLRQSVEQGLSISQIVPALLMLVLIVATPLVIWNILEELGAAYTPADDGLHFAALGIRLIYPWAGVAAIRRVDEDSDEPMDELALKQDYTGQIRSPLLRFMHVQAYGRTKLPIYAGVADRDELLDEIRRRAGLAEGAGNREQATEETEKETDSRETGVEGATL